MTAKAKASGSHGGRKKGHWHEGLTPDSIRTWRNEHKISRLALSRALNVSSTSVQNWETGSVVPVPRTQAAVLALMSRGPGALGGGRSSNKVVESIAASAGVSMIEGMKIEAVGRIVAAMIAHARAGAQLDLDGMVQRARNAIG